MRHNRGASAIYNPPIEFPVQIARELQEIAPWCSGVAIDIIMSGARKNQARALFKDLMENDDRAMTSLVQTIADLAEFYIFSQDLREGEVERMLVNVGQVVVNGFLAQAVETYPQEFERYLDRQQLADVRDYVRELELEIQKAQRFSQGGRSSGRGGGWQPNSRRDDRGGWNRGAGGGGRVSRWDEDVPDDRGGRGDDRGERDVGRGSWGSRTGRTLAGGTGRTIWDHERRPRVSEDGPPASVGRQARDFEAEAAAERAARAAHQPPTTTRGGRRSAGHPDPRATIIGNLQFLPVHDDQEWPKVLDRNRPWDWVLLQDGRQVRPAHQATDWKVTFNPAQPRTPWYDSNDSVLFYFYDPDGTVSEIPIKRNDTMDYLDHELDPALRQKEQETRQKIEGKLVPTWQLAESLRPVPDSPLTTEGLLGEEEAEEPVTLTAPEEFIVTTSLADAIKKAGVRMKLEHHDKLGKPYELYVDRVVLTTVINPNYLELYELQNATSFSHLLQLMGELSQQDLLEEVNDRLTVAVNNALYNNLGLTDWSIDEFVDDIGELIVVLKDKFGPVVVKVFEDHAQEIISRALTYVTVEELKNEKVHKLLDGVQDALVWRERASVTVLPVTAEELSVPADTGVLVSESAMPAVHKTIRAIFDRTPDMPYVYAGRFLATRDGATYLLAQGYFAEGSVMVYRTNLS